MWCSAADAHLKLLGSAISGYRCATIGIQFFNWMCLIVTLHIVDLCLYIVRYIRPGVTRCAHYMVIYLWRMWHMWLYGYHAVIWSQNGILMRLRAAKLHSATGLLFPSHDVADPVFDGVELTDFKSKAFAFFIGIKFCLLIFCLL